MDFKETISPLPLEQTTIVWVICSPYFDDTFLIAPERLDDTPIDQSYQEYQVNKSRSSTSTLHIILVGLIVNKGKDNISPS